MDGDRFGRWWTLAAAGLYMFVAADCVFIGMGMWKYR